MPNDLLQVAIIYEAMPSRHRVIIMDGKNYVEEFITDEELAVADDQRAMKRAFMDGLCVRWKSKYGTGIEIIDNGPGVEWSARYKDDNVEVRDEQADGQVPTVASISATETTSNVVRDQSD